MPSSPEEAIMLKKLETKRRWISDTMVQYVDIVFGVAVGQSIIGYIDVIRSPLVYPFAFIALVIVILTVTLSWIGYHKSMYDYPYKALSLSFKPRSRLTSGIRPFADFSIVLIYVLLLFTIDSFKIRVGSINLFNFIASYVLIFALYIVDGVIRRMEYNDTLASRLDISLKYEIGYVAVLGVYCFLVLMASVKSPTYVGYINWIFLLICTSAYLYYRRERGQHYTPGAAFKKNSITRIVIDVDGVLADQVTPVLKRLNDKFSSHYVKEDIKHWDEPLPLAHTNIKTAIEDSHREADFVKNMQPIFNAPEVVAELSKYFEISIATNRTEVADKPTRWWLTNCHISHDEYHNTSIEGKGKVSGDIIIDDYPKNILAFMEQPNRIGILFIQPWNIEDQLLTGKDNVFRAKDWIDVWNIINSFDVMPF